MSNIYLDTSRLLALIRNKRTSKTLRQISLEIVNVSASTLSRLENGSMPDMKTFLALCNWLQVPPGDLFVSDENQELNTIERVVILLLSDRNLDPDIAYAMSQLIKATWRERATRNSVKLIKQSKYTKK